MHVFNAATVYDSHVMCAIAQTPQYNCTMTDNLDNEGIHVRGRNINFHVCLIVQ